MTLIRRQKREKKPVIQLFNELFFEFTRLFESKHKVIDGVLYVDDILWPELQRLDSKWRKVIYNVNGNPKKSVKFKIEFFIEEAEKHIDRVKMNELNKYIDKFMHTIEIPDIKFLQEFPSEMEELTEQQFIYFAGELAKVLAGEASIDDLKTNIVFKFLDIRHNRKHYNDLTTQTKVEISENVYRVAELLDYFFVLDGDKVSINLSWTKNFIRKVKHHIWPCYGPDNALTDISFLEYKDANLYFRNYSQSKDEADLNRLVAVLYRPKYILSKKIKYNPEKLDKRALKMAKLPFNVRFGIYLFYSACENFLKNGTIHLDGQEINLSILYEQTLKEKQYATKQKYDSNTGLVGVAYSLAKTGIFGPIEKVFDQNLYDVLTLLYQQRIEYLNELENIKK